MGKREEKQREREKVVACNVEVCRSVRGIMLQEEERVLKWESELIRGRNKKKNGKSKKTIQFGRNENMSFQ